ncbi:hypothetical protein ACOYR1_02615 [Thalassotalea piscium]
MLNNSQTMVIPQSNTEPPAIKSYIYQAPKKKIVEAVAITTPEKTPITDNVSEAITVPEKQPAAQLPPPPLHKDENVINSTKSDTTNSEITVKKTTTANFSYNNIRRLREKIQQQNNAQLQRELSQPNTGSLLHGTPSLVPHSTRPMSIDQKKKQATLSMSADKSIVKGDDGNCSLVEDLSVVGMEGITAVSHFSCGESKFDRSFREHMDKVRKKLGKK